MIRGEVLCCIVVLSVFFFQAEDGIRDLVRSRGLGDVYKRQVLDTLGMDKEKDSLFYYQYLAKYFEKVNVKISNINLTLKVNDKKLVAYAEYSNKGIISIKDFVGDDELFDELITEFSLAISFDIYVEGFLRSKPVKEIILNEKQNYFIQSKNSKIISAYRTISDE